MLPLAVVAEVVAVAGAAAVVVAAATVAAAIAAVAAAIKVAVASITSMKRTSHFDELPQSGGLTPAALWQTA